jgi:hypothetical protein
MEESKMPNFQTIWNNHPNIKGDTPLLDRKVYANQCAINLSAALIRSDIPLNGFHGALSWQNGRPKYAIRAQELANWLKTPFPNFSKKFMRLSPKDFSTDLHGQRGIIFFQNYWGPGSQGDHIDLWNGSRLTHIRSLAQIYLRVGSFGLGSDYRDAELIWFWAIP